MLGNAGGVICVWFQVTMDPRRARWTGSSIIKKLASVTQREKDILFEKNKSTPTL